MIDGGKRNILGIEVNVIDYEAVVQRVITAARRSEKLAVSALAVHGVMTGVFDRLHASRLNRLDLVVPDGQPVRWALNLLYRAGLPDRCYGPSLTLKICEQAALEQLPVYFYGSRPEVVSGLVDRLAQRFPRLEVAGFRPSFFRRTSLDEKARVVESIQRSDARIVFVGLGCPRQEIWAYEYRDALALPIVAVGAAFDFISGFADQAPAAMQQIGLEWLYRLVGDCRRLWPRYMLLNPAYVLLATFQALRLISLQPNKAPIAVDREMVG